MARAQKNIIRMIKGSKLEQMVLEKRIEEKLVRYEVEIYISAMEAEMQERYRAVVPEKASYLRKQKMCKAEIERELAEA